MIYPESKFPAPNFPTLYVLPFLSPDSIWLLPPNTNLLLTNYIQHTTYHPCAYQFMLYLALVLTINCKKLLPNCSLVSRKKHTSNSQSEKGKRYWKHHWNDHLLGGGSWWSSPGEHWPAAPVFAYTLCIYNMPSNSPAPPTFIHLPFSHYSFLSSKSPQYTSAAVVL